MEDRVSRHRLRAFLVGLGAVLALALSLFGSAPKAQAKGWYWWGGVVTQCKYVEVRSGVYEDYAVIWANMIVSNEEGVPGNHYATNMRIKARLIPTTDGLNWVRHWNTVRVNTPLENHIYHLRMKGYTTNLVDPEKGWKIQVKFIWDRNFPFRDIVKKKTYHFDTCAPRDPSEAGEAIVVA